MDHLKDLILVLLDQPSFVEAIRDMVSGEREALLQGLRAAVRVGDSVKASHYEGRLMQLEQTEKLFASYAKIV